MDYTIISGDIGDIVIAPINGHKTKKLEIDGRYLDIDEEIFQLVKCLNKFGIKTTCSCEGVNGMFAVIGIDNKNIRVDEYNGENKYNLIFKSPSKYELKNK